MSCEMHFRRAPAGLSVQALAFGVLVVTAPPALVLAHDSVGEVEAQLQAQERFAELTNRVAPGFALVDAEGRAVRLEDFRGKVVILNFLYSRCEEACPLHSAKLATVQQQLAEASLGEAVQFATIATDTEDAASTAKSMRAHGPRYGLDPANWVFLHGGAGREDAGLRLAEAYGLKFVPTTDGEQMHAVVTHLIDADGRLRARYHGLDFAPVNLTLHAAALVHGDHHSKEGIPSAKAPESLREHWLAMLIGLVSLGMLFWITRSLYRKRRRARRPISRAVSASSVEGETR